MQIQNITVKKGRVGDHEVKMKNMKNKNDKIKFLNLILHINKIF